MATHPNPDECSLSDARSNFADITNEVAYAGKRIVLTRKGKRLVAIIPIEDLEALEAIENRVDLDDARKALADSNKHGTISWESIKRKLDL